MRRSSFLEYNMIKSLYANLYHLQESLVDYGWDYTDVQQVLEDLDYALDNYKDGEYVINILTDEEYILCGDINKEFRLFTWE